MRSLNLYVLRAGLVLMALLFSTTQFDARSSEDILAEAQTAFRSGIENKNKLVQARRDFSKATDAYLELHKSGVRNPLVYRDLGSAAFLADRLPEAIWAYHVGLRLDPNDREIREQLTHARTKVYYPPTGQGRPDADNWPMWLYRPSAAEWFTAFTALYALACIVIVLAYVHRNGGLAALAVVAVFLTMVAASGLWFHHQKERSELGTPLVVIATNASFHRGNGPSYPQHASVPILPRGMEARIIHERGDWLQLRLNTGEIGWLPRNQVLIVEP